MFAELKFSLEKCRKGDLVRYYCMCGEKSKAKVKNIWSWNNSLFTPSSNKLLWSNILPAVTVQVDTRHCSLLQNLVVLHCEIIWPPLSPTYNSKIVIRKILLIHPVEIKANLHPVMANPSNSQRRNQRLWRSEKSQLISSEQRVRLTDLKIKRNCILFMKNKK